MIEILIETMDIGFPEVETLHSIFRLTPLIELIQEQGPSLF